MSDLLARQIDGITALVTGANRGLGKALTQALLDRGAAKVYAGARDPGAVEVTDARIVPVRLDITNSVGVFTRERLQALAHILTASPELEKKASALGKQLLSVALAERMGVGPEDRRVRLAVTIRAAIIAGAYNAERDVRARIDPRDDGRVLERMVDRLNETFAQVTGREPPPPNRPSR